MDDKPKKRHAARSLPLICGYCGSELVRALRSAERVLIRCEACGRRLFAYYTDPERQHNGETPPEGEDRFFASQVIRELKKEVSRPAQVLYDFIHRYVTRHGYAPTLREMRDGVGWRSISTVYYYLIRLEEVGLIERDFASARGLRLKDTA